MENEHRTVTVPMVNRGWVQKIDPARLGEGQFQRLLNFTSAQEGSISTVQGRRLVGSLSGYTTAQALFRFPGTDLRYVSAADKIFRTDDVFAFYTEVASLVTPNTAGQPANEYRPTATEFASGARGKPYFYIAGAHKMLRDEADSPYASLRPWGILPPSRPCSAAAANPKEYSLRIVATGATAIPVGSSYTDISILGAAADLSTFSFATDPSGTAAEWYENSDYIYLDIELSNLGTDAVIEDMRLQFDVSGGAWTSYYEKAIIPSTLTSQAQLSQTPLEGMQDRTEYVDRGVVGVYGLENPDDATLRGTPYEIPAASSTVRHEVKISKNHFLRVGNVGATANWANVSGVRLRARSSGTVNPSINIHYAAMMGGYGPNTMAVGAEKYSYVYTFRDPVSGEESNPSIPMIADNHVEAERTYVVVTFGGTDDPNCPSGTPGTVAIYRDGGVLARGQWRFIGYGTNPGVSGFAPVDATFFDTMADADLAEARVAEWDNDPAITTDHAVDGTVLDLPDGGAVGWNRIIPSAGYTLHLNAAPHPDPAGTVITVGEGDKAERCVLWEYGANVAGSVGTNDLWVYFQKPHAVSEKISSSTVVTCGRMCVRSGESVYVAGDPFNPHVLHKSKSGRPRAFPVRVEGSGTVNKLNVGSPANPIFGVTELSGGEVVCLNRDGLYIVPVSEGQMQGPLRAPAARGLFAPYAWCKGENTIYYLAYDGIYRWSGGESVKISEAIDWVFNNRNVGDFQPLDPESTADITMVYYRSEVRFTYRDQGGDIRTLRYHTLYDRWVPSDSQMLAAVAEEDTGRMFSAEFDPSAVSILEEDRDGTSFATVGWSSLDGSDGDPIEFRAVTPFYDLGRPDIQKHFTDIVLEYTWEEYTGWESTDEFKVRAYYDYSSTPDITDTITLSPGSGRLRVALPLGSSGSPAVSLGKEARAVSFEFIGQCRKPLTIHSITFSYYPLTNVQRGRITDWQMLGSVNDKRFSHLWIDWYAEAETVLILDGRGGIDGVSEYLNIMDFTLPAGRGKRAFPIPDGVVYKAVRLRPVTAIPNYQIYGFEFKAEPEPEDITYFTDYDSVGHPYTKHFFHLWLKVDTNGKDVVVDVEADGLIAHTFTVNSTWNTTSQEIPVPVDFYAREVRLKVRTPLVADAKFQLFGIRWERMPYPPDVVYSTEYDTVGNDYLKYFQEVILDINTNGKNVQFYVDVDGVQSQTITVNSTLNDRKRRFTLQTWDADLGSAALPAGRGARLRVVTPLAADAMFQLFECQWRWTQAEPGPTRHTFDWDTLEWPHEKELETLTCEWDAAGTPVVMVMDLLGGLEGITQTLEAQTFTLTGNGRGINTFAINKDTICKAVRLRPQQTHVNFKHWKYHFAHKRRPADKVLFTDRTELDHPCDKILRGLTLQVDTGGVAASLQVECDGTLYPTYPATFTTTNARRDVELSVDPEIVGRVFRTIHTPGSGGKFQLYSLNWLDIKDACPFVKWNSYEQNFGSPGYKIMRGLWLDYLCAGQITLYVYVDGNQLLHTTTLAAHSTRSPVHIKLPPRRVSGAASILNRSLKYRVYLEAVNQAAPFKLYRDSSRLEYHNLTGEHRGEYSSNLLWERIPLQV